MTPETPYERATYIGELEARLAEAERLLDEIMLPGAWQPYDEGMQVTILSNEHMARIRAFLAQPSSGGEDR